MHEQADNNAGRTRRLPLAIRNRRIRRRAPLRTRCERSRRFGFASGVAPEIVIGLAALAITIASLAVGASFGSACSLGANVRDLGALIGFVVCYLLGGAIVRGVFR